MPDYDHEPRFGSFITPDSTRPRRAVDLAALSEDEGLDVVTVQDHPYQARFLDTWTLLTWIAARTSRIQVSGNVLNLPLRPPAVLARSVASLDLLSGGRAVLGLGAGGFSDAIASMGGPRRTTADSVSAIDEALDVIRGIWDGADPGPLSVDGRFYRVEDLQRGPSPAHEVPIWLGAYKPRMQRIIGRKADGWLPSLPWLEPGDLAEGNRVIDEAATRAGRDPRDITRLLNVTPSDGAADLARIAVEDGVSVFVVASDDPAELRRFARTTAPEIRERIAEARTSGRSGSPRVTAFAGDPVPASLASRALTPGADGYARYTAGYFRGGRPGLVLRPRTPAEVQDAVRYAARHRDVPLGLLSGGHGLSGRSLNDGGIVIALDALDRVEVLDGHRVRIGPGARWGDVASRLAPHGLAISAGDHGGVGVGGLATTGGIGWFVREHGLTIDHVRSVDLVTAAGDLVHADADENPDLFWAMRGAGANFGVAVAFEIDAHPVGERVGFAMLAFAADDVAAFLRGWGSAIESAHAGVTGTLMIGPTPPGRPATVQALVVVDSQDPDTIVDRLTPLTGLAPLVDQSVQLVPYSALLASTAQEQQHGRGEPVSHAGLLRHLTDDAAAAIADLVATRDRFVLSIRSTGGAAANTPSDATAYAWRDANFLVAALGGSTPEYQDRWSRLLPHFEGTYLSFETDTGPDALARAFPPAHLRRLRALKRRWDPTALFRDNFAIDPAADDADEQHPLAVRR